MRVVTWLLLSGCVAAGCVSFSTTNVLGDSNDAGLPATDGGSADTSVLDGPAAADAGDATDAGSDAGADVDVVEAGPLRVFVSEETYTTMNPLTVCQSLAGAAALGGTWVAWLARSDGTPLTHLGAGPWHRMDPAKTLVATLADLEGGVGLTAPVHNTQHGNDVTSDGGNTEMWTGLDATGTLTGNDCSKWTASAGSFGTIGYADRMDVGWTTTGYTLCGFARHSRTPTLRESRAKPADPRLT